MVKGKVPALGLSHQPARTPTMGRPPGVGDGGWGMQRGRRTRFSIEICSVVKSGTCLGGAISGCRAPLLLPFG